MNCKIVVDLGNAAFADDTKELGRILREAAQKVDDAFVEGPTAMFSTLRDINGHKVGSVVVETL
jgi:hypothetical protein